MIFSHRRFTFYMLRQLATPVFLGLFLYTFVLLMNHFFLIAEKALSKNLSFDLTLRLFLVGIPKLLVLSIPMAVLLGTLIGLGRLSADHEWVALQGAGHGPWTLLRPVLLVGITGSLVSFGIYGYLVPRSSYALRSLRGEVLFASNLAADLKPRVFYQLPHDSVVFIDEIRAGADRRLENVLFIQFDREKDQTELVVAKFGDLRPASDRSGALIVDLYDAEVRAYSSDAQAAYKRLPRTKRITRKILPPRFLQAFLGRGPQRKVVQDFELRELLEELGDAKQAVREIEADPNSRGSAVALARLRVAAVEWHQRLALPLASLLFALLSMPLGISRVRSGKGAGFAMSLLVILVYWFIFVLTRNLSARPGSFVSPVIGVWLANIVILIWAIIALWRMRRAPPGDGGLLARLSRGVGAAVKRLRKRRIAPAEQSGTAQDLEDADLGEMVSIGGTQTRFVARLDRYVGMTYLRVLGFAVASAYLIFILLELRALTEDLLRSGGSPRLLVSYVAFFAPGVLHIILPISCLIAAIVAFTLLARSSELVAMVAAGVGLFGRSVLCARRRAGRCRTPDAKHALPCAKRFALGAA